MTWTDAKLRLRALFQRRRVERELDEEMNFHLSMEARKLAAAGADRARAARQAQAAFGGVDRVAEECRDTRGLRWLEDAAADLRFALRRLRRAPAFAAVAIVTLALGIGANTALFTLVDAVLLRRLPVPRPEQLVALGDPGFTGLIAGVSDYAVPALTYHQYTQLRDQNRVFSGVLAADAGELTFGIDWGGVVDPEVPIKLVSANYFRVLGIQAARGRFFGPDEATPAGLPEAVMGYAYWRRQFGGDPGVIGRRLRIRATAFTVIGIAPKGFFGITVGQQPALYFPLALQPLVWPGRDLLHDPPSMRRFSWLQAVGRLRTRLSLAQAAADSAAIFHQSVLAQAEAARDAKARADILTQTLPVASAATGASPLRSDFARPLWILFALVGVVLLLVAVNLGGILLAQAASRQREFATRLALGARRSRLVRQLLAESLLLAAAGGLLGWWLAQWGARLLVAMVASGSGQMWLDVTPDARVLAFTIAACLLVGVGLGLAPAWRLARAELARDASDRHGARASQLLVVAQVALSIVLVAGAALCVRSLAQLRQTPLGFDPHGLVTFNLNAVSAGASGAEAVDIYDRVAEAARRLPGVQAASFSENGLFSGSNSGDPITVDGYAGDAYTALDKVAPGYFAALGIPVRQGREFLSQDRTRVPAPVVIDEALARRYFAGRNPLGQHITVNFSDGALRAEVVGVAAVVKQQSPRDQVRDPRLYLDIFNGRRLSDLRDVNFELRASPPALLTRATINAAVASVAGRHLLINRVGAVQGLLDATLAPDLLLARLTSFFGLLGLGLAAMGLYAMLSYAVARRRGELAIRMALGARAGQVVALVLRQALVLLALGMALGAAASLALGRGLASLLFQMRPSDPASLGAAALLLLAAGLAAAWAPALRASRTDPARTLRADS